MPSHRFRAVLAVIVTSNIGGAAAFRSLQSPRSLPSCRARSGTRPTIAPACCSEPVRRREFLLASVGGVVGTQVAQLRPLMQSAGASAPQQRPLRVCVVGAGSISREFALYHFGLATKTVVTSIVDLDIERARRLAVDVGSVMAGAAIESSRAGGAYSATAAETRGDAIPFSAQLTPCLKDCDIVYIGTTPGSHSKLVLAALEAGKSVLLEKPLASTPVSWFEGMDESLAISPWKGRNPG